ncbi:MAG: hypothetical protein C0404_08545 [Verrucomicrobia bacterium]|nr:hypothetical protein [Verrucomicrobiota bacterium]
MSTLVTDSLRRSLLKMAGPTMIGALLQSAQWFIDLYWVGGLGTEAVAAISVGGILTMTLFPVIMGLSTGTMAIISRAIGAGNQDEAADTAGQSLTLGLLVGLLTGFLGFVYAGDLCRYLGATPEVAALGKDYLEIYFLFSFTLFVMLMCSSIFQGVGDSYHPMIATLIATSLNAVLAPILIYGLWGFPAVGIKGAAIATVISQGLAAAVLMFHIYKGRARIHVSLARLKLRRDLVKRIVGIGLPSSGQMLARNLIGLILLKIVSRYGTAAVAAYGIGMRFHMTMLMPAFVLGNSVAPIVGQNLGAGKPERSSAAAWLATGIDLAVKVVIATILVAWASSLVSCFDTNHEVVTEGKAYLRIITPFLLFAGIAIVLGRALQGAGDVVAPMVATVISLWGIQLPLALLLPHYFNLNINGVWWAISIATVVHGLMIWVWFQTGRWKHKKV